MTTLSFSLYWNESKKTPFVWGRKSAFRQIEKGVKLTQQRKTITINSKRKGEQLDNDEMSDLDDEPIVLFEQWAGGKRAPYPAHYRSGRKRQIERDMANNSLILSTVNVITAHSLSLHHLKWLQNSGMREAMRVIEREREDWRKVGLQWLRNATLGWRRVCVCVCVFTLLFHYYSHIHTTHSVSSLHLFPSTEVKWNCKTPLNTDDYLQSTGNTAIFNSPLLYYPPTTTYPP